MDNQELEYYIKRFNNERDINLNITDLNRIFNYLEELLMYRKAGTINEVLDLKGKYKTIKYAFDLQMDVISRLEKTNGDYADRLVKSEGLISDGEIRNER
jgi:hypothetical protein